MRQRSYANFNRAVMKGIKLPSIRKEDPMTDISAPHLHPVSATKRPQIDPALKAAATELEAAFLAEMLKSAGLGQAREAMGGGAGEAQFASLLATEHAKALAKAGGWARNA